MYENLRKKTVLGAAAGNLTVNGIKQGDRLISVEVLDFTLAEGTPNTRTWTAPVDITAEFKVTADNTINNTGGTSSAGKLVTILYEAYSSGRTDAETTLGRSRF